MSHIILFLIFCLSSIYNVNLALSLKKLHKIENIQNQTDKEEPFRYDLFLSFAVSCLVISVILLISIFIILFI